MKLQIAILCAAAVGALGCTHNQPPRTAGAAPSTVRMQTPPSATADRAEAEVSLLPGAPAIPSDPQVAPPHTPVSTPTDEQPITKSSNFASPRPDSLPPVAVDPMRDEPQTSADEESVREIRALLAADRSLSATARQITIIARSGRVRLTGQVNTAAERAAVERSARKAANVIDVKNQLVVLE